MIVVTLYSSSQSTPLGWMVEELIVKYNIVVGNDDDDDGGGGYYRSRGQRMMNDNNMDGTS
jgi:hypothetical protein